MRERKLGASMQLGVVFSQAGSGTDPAAFRRFATESEAGGYGHFMAYEEALSLGFSHLSFGYHRMADPTASLDKHLSIILGVKAEADHLVG